MPTYRKESLISTPLPSRPFQMVGADICEVKGQNYLVLIDYYSRYLEILFLSSLTSHEVIVKFKSMFAQHGIPETLVTDNGRQFTSGDFQKFSKEWNFQHITSSPYYAQSNGEAERAVQEAKKILKQTDPFLALMTYRATPTTATGFSPAELAMGRKIRTIIPTLPSSLEPKIIKRTVFQGKEEERKSANEYYFNRRHGSRNLSELEPGTKVLQKLDDERQWGNPATIIKKVAPRSYLIQTTRGTIRRNRRHLRPTSTFLRIPIGVLPYTDKTVVTEQQEDVPMTQPQRETNQSETSNTRIRSDTETGTTQGQNIRMTRSGRVVKTPARYQE
jgi:transposase InsO family protein